MVILWVHEFSVEVVERMTSHKNRSSYPYDSELIHKCQKSISVITLNNKVERMQKVELNCEVTLLAVHTTVIL